VDDAANRIDTGRLPGGSWLAHPGSTRL
jgi:hypothetical protein